MARRNVVLQAMLDTGAIDQRRLQVGARQQGRCCTTRCAPKSRTASTSRNRSAASWSTRFGWQRVYQGGLRVFSTIDMPMQIAAEAAVADQLKAIETRRAAWQARRAAARQKADKAPRRSTSRRRCRRRWSRSIRPPATSARWSAAATSTPAISTAPCRRGGRPARRSSRSSMPRRSKAGYVAGHRASTNLDEPIATAAGRLDAGRRTFDRPTSMTPAHGAAHVEQPRRGAACCSRSASRAPSSTRRRWASATCRACRRSRSDPAR